MKVGEVLRQTQPDQYKTINKRKRKRKRKKKKQQAPQYKDELSFQDFDRMMKQRVDIDDRKCRG